jgi:HPt (histidine-containing phosphotransfer) domain-containing protein
MDELYAKFLPQFIQLARERMQRAYATAARPDHAGLVTAMRDLHGIAGEGGLLGLAHIVPLARDAEEQAKEMRDAGAGADADSSAFLGALDQLRAEIDKIAATIKPKEAK